MKLIPTSIRLRLTLWYSLGMISILSVFSVGIHFLTSRSLEEQLDRDLNGRLYTLTQAVKTLPGDPEELIELEAEMFASFFLVTRNDSLLHRTTLWKTSGLPVRHGSKSGMARYVGEYHGHTFRFASDTLSVHGAPYAVNVAVPMDQLEGGLDSLSLAFKIGLPIGLLLALAGGNLLAKKAFSPIAVMAELAENITTENLQARLPIVNPSDEIGRLAATFNGMLERVEAGFDRLKRFTSDASHELRTPLTAIRSIGEVALNSESGILAYREAISSILEESNQLSMLVQDLLFLTRIENGKQGLKITVVDLGELVKGVCVTLGVLAEEKNQKIVFEQLGRVTAQLDASIFRLTVINLIDNAIRHSPSGGVITITVWKNESTGSNLTIRDEGPGIAPEHQGRIFDRFYKVDEGRARESSGFGLGLSIARWAVEINGGKLELAESGPQGSLFRVTLPSGENS